MRIPAILYPVFFLALVAVSSLQGQPRITYPNGGESLYPWKYIGIRWEGVDSTQSVGLQYSSDGGNSWDSLTGNASGLQYWWHLPNKPSQRYLVRLDASSGGQRILKGYSGQINDVSYSSDGRFIIADPYWTGIVVKDSRSGETVWDLVHADQPRPNPVYGTMITITSGTGILRDVSTGAVIDTLSKPAAAIAAIDRARFTPDGLTLVSLHIDGEVNVWDGLSGEHLRTLGRHLRQGMDIGFSRTGERIVTFGFSDSIAKVWDLKTGALVRDLRAPSNNTVVGVAISPDGSKVALLSQEDGEMYVYDAVSGNVLFSGSGKFPVVFSPDGSQVLAGIQIPGGEVNVYDAVNGRLLHSLTGPVPTLDIDYSPDGERIAIIGYSNFITLWNARTGELEKTLKGHTSSVLCGEFSRDGRSFISGGRDGVVRIWTPDEIREISDVSDATFAIQTPLFASYEVDMGPVLYGLYRDSLVAALIRNSSNKPLRVENFTTIGPDSASFALLPDTSAIEIPPGSTADIWLRFTPAREGIHDAGLLMDVDGQPMGFGLTGEGVVPASVAGESREGGTLNIYPNPAGDRMTAEFVLPKAGPVRLLVQDLFGRVVRFNDLGTLASGPHGAEVDMSALASGSYLLVLDAPGGRRSSRITVVR